MIQLFIVDDVEQVRQGLHTLLTLAAAKAGLPLEIVSEAANGKEAIALLDTACPDTILMDLEMPAMDGWTAAREIRAQYPQVRLVAITAHADAESQEAARRAGFDAVVVKGAAAAQILRAITPEN
jgi:DNA-binding NarL/FixJ family response regulator